MKKNTIQLTITPIYGTSEMTKWGYTPNVTDYDWLYTLLSIEAKNCVASLEGNILTLTYKPHMGCIAGRVAYKYAVGCNVDVQYPKDEHMARANTIISHTYMTKMLALVQGLNTGRWA